MVAPKILAVQTTGQLFSALSQSHSGCTGSLLGFLSCLDMGEENSVLVMAIALVFAAISLISLMKGKGSTFGNWSIVPILGMSVCETIGILSMDIFSSTDLQFSLLIIVGVSQIALTLYYYYRYLEDDLSSLVYGHAALLFVPAMFLAIVLALELDPLVDIVFWILVIVHVVFMLMSITKSPVYSITSLFLLLPSLLIAIALGWVLLVVVALITVITAAISAMARG